MDRVATGRSPDALRRQRSSPTSRPAIPGPTRGRGRGVRAPRVGRSRMWSAVALGWSLASPRAAAAAAFAALDGGRGIPPSRRPASTRRWPRSAAAGTTPVAAAEGDDAAAGGGAPPVNAATIQFNNRLNRKARSRDATTAPWVESLLQDAVDKYREGRGGIAAATAQLVIPNTVSFTNAITAWARCTRKDAAPRAEALLDQMHALHRDEGWEHVAPNNVSYNSVITAWARSREKGGARRGEELLRRMYDAYHADGGGDNRDLKPNARSWNAVINAVARSRDPDCAERAAHLLNEMGRLYDEGDAELLPDALAFGAVINAYANSGAEGSSDKAAQLLMHMESLASMGFEDAKPITFVYNACMNAFAKDPLISSSPNKAEQAAQILESMERRYQEEQDQRVMPDCISYSTVINAYANSKTPLSGVHADAVLRRMTQRYLLGDAKCRPNAVALTATMKAHAAAIGARLDAAKGEEAGGEEADGEEATRGDPETRRHVAASARRCEDLLQQLCTMRRLSVGERALQPSGVTFEVVLKALTRAGDVEGAARVQALQEAGE